MSTSGGRSGSAGGRALAGSAAARVYAGRAGGRRVGENIGRSHVAAKTSIGVAQSGFPAAASWTGSDLFGRTLSAELLSARADLTPACPIAAIATAAAPANVARHSKIVTMRAAEFGRAAELDSQRRRETWVRCHIAFRSRENNTRRMS